MKAGKFRFLSCLSAVLWLIFSMPFLFSQGKSDEHRQFVAQRLLVKFRPEVEKGRAVRLAAEHNASIEGEIGDLGIKVLHVPMGISEEGLARLLASKPEVEFADLDHLNPPGLTPSDTYYAQQWHLPKISAPAAWDTTTGSGVIIIAILDTGVDSSHPDLASRLIPGWNIYDNNSNTSDVYGHGTSTAGTAAAAGNNSLGVASVAMDCLIMPVRISGPDGWATDSAIAAGLNWAANHGARVANISYAVSGHAAVSNAAKYFQSKGGVVSVSAGNDGAVSSAPDDPYVLTISATSSSDAITSWSNRGSNIDLAAPGLYIYTTKRGGGYGSVSGTSFSAPIVAGAAALVMSINPDLLPSQVESILKQSADDLGTPEWDALYGYGRVNAAGAVSAASSDVVASPPTVSITSPASGSTVSGNVTVNASATSSVGIDSVSLSVDGELVATDVTSPFSFALDTTAWADGAHTLEATATDTQGSTGSVSITVNAENRAPAEPPIVNISFPSSSTTVSGTVKVQVSATSEIGIASVTLTVDDQLLGTDTGSPYEFTWATASFTNGTHRLTATARDSAGNTGSASVDVVVDNAADTSAPAIAITSPKEGTVVKSTVLSILVSVSDDVGVTKVELYADNGTEPVSVSTVAPFTTRWSIRKVPKGTHTLQCRAYDAAGNVGYSQIVNVVTTK